ncbi:MAG: PBS lyase, partial [Desulfobacteraceae bacterium]
VKEFKVDQIVSVAGEDKKIIRNLQRLLYSGDDLFRRRAAEVLGQVSAIIAENNPGAISKLLQRLFYAITDTAASSWGAFEAIGEILSHKIELFAGYIPQLYQFLADESRRPQVLQTLGRIAKSRPDLMRKVTFHFIPYLSDSDPLVRGYAAWLMGHLSAAEAREDLEKLREDPHEIHIYENGQMEKKTVGEVASGALQVLRAEAKSHINKQ